MARCMRVTMIVILLIAISIISGCRLVALVRESPLLSPPLPLLPTPAFMGCEQYAVADETHLLLYALPSHTADVTRISRSGEIFTVQDSSTNPQQYYGHKERWYLLNQSDGIQGWGFGAQLTTHCYYYQAELQRQLLERANGSYQQK